MNIDQLPSKTKELPYGKVWFRNECDTKTEFKASGIPCAYVHDLFHTGALKALRCNRDAFNLLGISKFKNGGNARWVGTCYDAETDRLVPELIQVKVVDGKPKYQNRVGGVTDCIELPVPKDSLSKEERLKNGLVLCEGIKKAAVVMAFSDYYAVSCPGVECFNTQTKDGTVRERLKTLVKQAIDNNVRVLIVFDSDCLSKDGVKGALMRTYQFYTCADIENVKFIDLTGYTDKGIDDILSREPMNVEEKRELLERIFAKEIDMETVVKESSFKNVDKQLKSAQDITEFLLPKYADNWKFDNAQQVWRYWNGKYWESKHNNLLIKVVKEDCKTERIKFGSTA